ncbi:MAG: F0F1 ATP synthase subunit B [Candidatus Kapaibacterium sp.]
MVDISTGPIIWTIINFVILLLVLTKLGWKSITQSLEKRETTINDAIEQAERAREEAKQLIADNRQAMAHAEAEAQELLRESREYAQKVRDEAMGKAEEEARTLIDRAKSEIDRSKKEAMNQLRAEVATLAVNASEKILKESLNQESGERLVEAYLNEAAEVTN